MAEPILKLTRGVPKTDREWMDVFRNLTRFFRVSGDELQIGGDIALPEQSVGTAELEDLAVTDPKLRQSQACSVIGRGANSAGAPTDIQASMNGHFLRRSGDVLAFGAIVDTDIPASIARDSEITTAIANHEGASDPHPGYTTAAELSTAISNHASAADPHTVYPLAGGPETISGAWTFTANAGAVTLSAAIPLLRFTETDAAVDNGGWRLYANGEDLVIDAINDAGTVATQFFRTLRTGTTIDEVRFTASLVRLEGAVRVDASTTTTAPGAGGAGALPATPAGYVTINIGGTNRQIPYY